MPPACTSVLRSAKLGFESDTRSRAASKRRVRALVLALVSLSPTCALLAQVVGPGTNWPGNASLYPATCASSISGERCEAEKTKYTLRGTRFIRV